MSPQAIHHPVLSAGADSLPRVPLRESRSSRVAAGRGDAPYTVPLRGVAQPGRALALGARGRSSSPPPRLVSKIVALALALAGVLLLPTWAASASPRDAASQGPPAFRGTIERIDAAQAKRMTGVSWRPGCPVPLRDLRLLTLSHWGFDGRARTGRLIVHRDVATELVARLPRALRRRGSRSAEWFRSTRTARATSVRSRPTTRRRSTAATSTAPPAGPSTRTGGRSTSIRSRIRTSPGVGRRIAASRAYVDRVPRRPGYGVRRRLARPGVRSHRMGLGRPLDVGQGLPALLGIRPLKVRRRPKAPSRSDGSGALTTAAGLRSATRYPQIAPPSTPPASGPMM